MMRKIDNQSIVNLSFQDQKTNQMNSIIDYLSMIQEMQILQMLQFATCEKTYLNDVGIFFYLSIVNYLINRHQVYFYWFYFVILLAG